MNELTWVDLVVAQTEESADTAHTVWMLLGSASGPVLFVLLVLVVASFASWFIIGYKYVAIRRAMKESKIFADVFWQSKRLDEIYQEADRLVHSPTSAVFQAGYVELRKLRAQDSESSTIATQLGGIENVERALRRAVATEVSQLEQLISFLATVGSTAPFIGLFGTVWGIMIAFMNLQGAEGADTSIDVVAGPIAEALIATAIGLVAAIPAVVAYNYFQTRIQALSVDMDNFSIDFLNIVKRHFFK